MLTRKHFVRTAAIVKDTHGLTDIERQILAEEFAIFFSEENQNFDEARFMGACLD
jgi:hypothetical protein